MKTSNKNPSKSRVSSSRRNEDDQSRSFRNERRKRSQNTKSGDQNLEGNPDGYGRYDHTSSESSDTDSDHFEYGNKSGYGNNRGQNQDDDSGRHLNKLNDEHVGSNLDDYGYGNQSINPMQKKSNKGKGPKNYQRSDQRISEDVNDRLSEDHHLDASEIEVRAEGGEVFLSGTVGDKKSKRRAEDIADSVMGVKNVENRLRVSNTSGND